MAGHGLAVVHVPEHPSRPLQMLLCTKRIAEGHEKIINESEETKPVQCHCDYHTFRSGDHSLLLTLRLPTSSRKRTKSPELTSLAAAGAMLPLVPFVVGSAEPFTRGADEEGAEDDMFTTVIDLTMCLSLFLNCCVDCGNARTFLRWLNNIFNEHESAYFKSEFWHFDNSYFFKIQFSGSSSMRMSTFRCSNAKPHY